MKYLVYIIYFFRWKVKFTARFLPRYFGLNRLDEKLATYLNYKNGYFVELGANDGILQSNTKHFELFHNWRGVLVEPSSINYRACIRNRAKRTLSFESACVSFEYSSPFVRMLFSNLMTIALEGKSDIDNRESHALGGIPFLDKGQNLHEFLVPARTLNSILIEAQAPKFIDLLSLDVEGLELEVLKGLNHDQFRFKYIVVEVRNFETINSFLTSSDYSLVEKLTVHDYLYENVRNINH